jgi:outer membrane immunogenic protein
LVFATGGVAVGRNESNYTSTATGAPLFQGFEGRSTNVGWFAGGGVEWAVTNNIILGVEYQHFDLDSERATRQLSTTDVDNIALASEGDIVRARLSFKLGRPEERYEPMK